MAKLRAAVIGGSGYGGGEMIRRLLHHPHVELVRVSSIDHVGEPLSAVHLSLEGQTELTFEALPPAEAAKDVDVVLLGLPHKVSATVMRELMATGARIVDMSGDFRLRDVRSYEKYYGGKHPCPEELEKVLDGKSKAALVAEFRGEKSEQVAVLLRGIRCVPPTSVREEGSEVLVTYEQPNTKNVTFVVRGDKVFIKN